MRDVYVTAVVGDPSKAIAASPELANLSSDGNGIRLCGPHRARADHPGREPLSEMRTATNRRLVLEIALTRIARPESDLTLESLAERIGNLERQVAALSVPGRVATPTPAPAATSTSSRVRPGRHARLGASSRLRSRRPPRRVQRLRQGRPPLRRRGQPRAPRTASQPASVSAPVPHSEPAPQRAPRSAAAPVAGAPITDGATPCSATGSASPGKGLR